MKKAGIIATLLMLTMNVYGEMKLVTGAPLNSQQEEMPVKGRNGFLINQKLRFGAYHTLSVKRSAIVKVKETFGIDNTIWTEHSDGKQTIHFRLTDDTYTSDVIATSRVSMNDLVIGRNPGNLPGPISSILRIGTGDQENNFSVAIYTLPGEKPWQLFLDNNSAELERKTYLGFVSRGDEYYTVAPVWQIERKGKTMKLPFGCAGFEIRNEHGDALAAVSLLNNGTVYMGKLDSKEQFLMANICAALLLQTNISE